MIKPARLLVATNNRGKLREYAELLKGLPFELTTLSERGITEEVEETGSSLKQNAIHKATTYAKLSGLTTMADDSGLEVDALGGEPGPLSRRYAGDNVSDKERNDYLLAKLRDVPREKRTARFRCIIAIAMPEGRAQVFEGECRGMIALEPKGGNGFGYDPVFYLPEFDKTIAELPAETKNQVSHRGQAARKAYKMLEQLAEKVKA